MLTAPAWQPGILVIQPCKFGDKFISLLPIRRTPQLHRLKLTSDISSSFLHCFLDCPFRWLIEKHRPCRSFCLLRQKSLREIYRRSPKLILIFSRKTIQISLRAKRKFRAKSPFFSKKKKHRRLSGDSHQVVHHSGLDWFVLIEISRNEISNFPYYFLADSTYIRRVWYY